MHRELAYYVYGSLRSPKTWSRQNVAENLHKQHNTSGTVMMMTISMPEMLFSVQQPSDSLTVKLLYLIHQLINP